MCPDLVVSHRRNSWVIKFKVALEGESPEKKAEEALASLHLNFASCESESLHSPRGRHNWKHLLIR